MHKQKKNTEVEHLDVDPAAWNNENTASSLWM